jgi:hypothetical protein
MYLGHEADISFPISIPKMLNQVVHIIITAIIRGAVPTRRRDQSRTGSQKRAGELNT